jgi:hypothetical protein
MLDPAWHHKEVTDSEVHVAIAQLYPHVALDDQEHFILIVVRMPRGRANALGHFEELTVSTGNHLLRPEFRERRRFIHKRYFVHNQLLDRS